MPKIVYNKSYIEPFVNPFSEKILSLGLNP